MAEDKGFEVNDKRKVFSEGDAGEPARKEESAGPVPGQDIHAHEHEHEHEMPPVDFSSFIGSLAANAFLLMGEKFAPEQPDIPKDLESARQMIDLLGLLQEKTQGNLTKDEAGMLEAMLYNLRMRYVKESSSK
jgi:hypothetical protein